LDGFQSGSVVPDVVHAFRAYEENDGFINNTAVILARVARSLKLIALLLYGQIMDNVHFRSAKPPLKPRLDSKKVPVKFPVLRESA
jgi:hypothetical protein